MDKTTNVSYGSTYLIFHSILSIFAIYLSFRCNQGFNVLSFLIAIIAPWIYVPYSLALGCSGIPIFPKLM